MIYLEELQITNVRAFRTATFNFKSGMNLIIGINGVGKSTVLDVLRIALSHIMPTISPSKAKLIDFQTTDITIGERFLTVELQGNLQNEPFAYLIHKPESKFANTSSGEGQVREQTLDTPEISTWIDKVGVPALDVKAFNGKFNQLLVLPLSIFYSAHRSLLSNEKPVAVKSGQEFAYSDALRERPFRIAEYAEWWLTRKALSEESNSHNFLPLLNALQEAVSTFLEGSEELFAEPGQPATLYIKKANKIIDVRLLSDGERSVLAVVLDITRRLALANPNLSNPALEASAVILIDELDLHLHPGWQREIIHRLEKTFPKCQFIATTHSPQCISEVQPDKLTVVSRKGDEVVTELHSQTYGLDTSWILEHLMNVKSRPLKVQQLIDEIEEELEVGNLDKARSTVQILRELLHGDDPDVVRLETSIYNLETLANEMDKEDE